MNNINILFPIFYLISFLIFLHKRSKLMMHFFQQEEYENKRFIKYISNKLRFIDKRLSGIILLFTLSLILTKTLYIHLSIISALLLISALTHPDPCKKAKKILVYTKRVKRIFTTFYFIFISILLISFFRLYSDKNNLILYLITIVYIQLIPFIIVLANFLLSPIEKRIRNKFLQEAKQKIKHLQPIIIGITGSYGKTSTKHILEHIMCSISPTLATPGSVNTEMGITRIIREQLKPLHKYFIVEMGAYYPKAISNRCELTPPTYGIITSIGNSHYERFKNEENIAKTKFELAQAVFKNKEGKLVLNADAINKRYINKYCKKHKANIFKISTSPKEKDAYLISEEKLTKNGVEFKMQIGKKSFKIKAPLYGKHQISNIALSFALAYNLGVEPETIIASLKSVPQIKHRLEVNKVKANYNYTLIDDAYNANPTGFKSALEILKLLKQKNGRTILVTPGMAELGNLHNEEHYEIGKIAGKFVDIALIVVPKRIKSFINGFKETAKAKQKLLEFDTFYDAKQWLDKNLLTNDTVLYENDLPDLYETKIKI